MAVNVLSIRDGKDLDLLTGVINQIEYPVIANPNSGAFPAMKPFDVAGIGIFFKARIAFMTLS